MLEILRKASSFLLPSGNFCRLGKANPAALVLPLNIRHMESCLPRGRVCQKTAQFVKLNEKRVRACGSDPFSI